MLPGGERIESHKSSTLPFGYYVELEPEVLLLRRPDDTLVAAFSARGLDFFEVELTVWEDAD
jgi:hypothetical protein